MKKATVSEKSISFEEALADPNLSQFHEAIHFLQKTPKYELMPRKYRHAQQNHIEEKIKKILKTDPEMPLNKVTAIILNGFPEDLPPHLVLEFTQFAIAQVGRVEQMFAAPAQGELG